MMCRDDAGWSGVGLLSMRITLIALIITVPGIAPGGFNRYSPAEETAIGTKSSEMFKNQLRVVHDARIDAYVGQLTAKLAGQVKSPFHYSVVVFAGPVPERSRRNAFVMPADYMRTDFREPLSVAGGAIFVPLSMLADAPREEWFAFQIAHAMAHIACHHAARLESRMELVAMPGVTGTFPDPAVAGPAFLSSIHRFELDADGEAVSVLSDAGYDANRVLPLGGPAGVKTERREESLAKVVARLPKRDYGNSQAGFVEAKRVAASHLQE